MLTMTGTRGSPHGFTLIELLLTLAVAATLAGMAVPLGVENLAAGLRAMLNPTIRDEITARREEVKGELSWDEPIAQTIALYERIIAQNRKLKG